MSRRLFSAVMAAVFATTILQASVASAEVESSTGPAMGVQFHALWSDYTDEQRTIVLDKMAAAGVKWVRVDVGWVTVESEGKGVYSQWYVDRLERVVTAAEARGIQVLATFWGTPAWANDGGSRSTPPTDPADFASAAAWIVDRFKGRIPAWEVWNEPNHSSFWTGTAADYAHLLKAAYPAIKTADPGAKVVFGGPSYNDVDWIAAAYDAGAGGAFDIMATHPYQGMADQAPETPDDGTQWTLAHVAAVKQLMVARGDGDKPIWFTEFGWSAHDNWEGISNWQRGVSAEEQGDYLVRTLQYLAVHHPYVTNVFWYNERNRDTGKVHMDNYGLLNHDLTDKIAYTELKNYLTSGLVEEPAPVAEPVVEEPAADVQASAELLPNGGFDGSLTGWSAKKSGLKLVGNAPQSGTHAAKATRRGDPYGALSAPVALDRAADLTVSGFIKGARTNQTIRLVLTESVGGTLHDREVLKTTVTTDWEAFPTLTYTSSGLADSSVRVKVLSTGKKGDYFFLDTISLRG